MGSSYHFSGVESMNHLLKATKESDESENRIPAGHEGHDCVPRFGEETLLRTCGLLDLGRVWAGDSNALDSKHRGTGCTKQSHPLVKAWQSFLDSSTICDTEQENWSMVYGGNRCIFRSLSYLQTKP